MDSEHSATPPGDCCEILEQYSPEFRSGLKQSKTDDSSISLGAVAIPIARWPYPDALK